MRKSIYFGSRWEKYPSDKKPLVLEMLAEGTGINAVVGALGISERTISCWLHREGERLKRINKEKV